MNAALRRSLSAAGVALVVAALLGGALSAALSLYAEQASVVDLAAQSEALRAREVRLGARPGRPPPVSAAFEANTITQAGAALQSRVEAAIAGAKGRLVSSRVDIEQRGAERRLALAAELTIAEPDFQALLFDLETGRPYLFVDALEARAADTPGEGGALRVSLGLSGQWSGAK